MWNKVKWTSRAFCLLLGFSVAIFSLPAHAVHEGGKKHILVVSEMNAPGDTSGANRREDDALIAFLQARFPTHTIDTSGMNGAYQDTKNPFGIPIAGGAVPRLIPADSELDLVIFSAATRTGFYTGDRYRDVEVANGGDGTVDVFGRAVEDSWNGMNVPILTFTGGLVTSKRFGWVQTDSNVQIHKFNDQTNMQISNNQLNNPFYAGLTTTGPVAPTLDEVTGEGFGSGKTEVQLYNWPGGQIPEFPLGIGHPEEGNARSPMLFRRAGERPDLRVELLDGSIARSGFGGETWWKNPGDGEWIQFGGELMVDIPKGTNFNNPHVDPDWASAPDHDNQGPHAPVPGDDGLHPPAGTVGYHPDVADESVLHAHHRPGFNVSEYNEPPTGGTYQNPQFGIAGARRVSLADWNYFESLPSSNLALVDPQPWDAYKTADYLDLIENVIADMLLNPDAALTVDGDFDWDDDADGADFLKWQRELGDAANLALWEGNFGTIGVGPAVGAGTGAVPEPSSIALVVVSALALVGGARRGLR